MKKVAIISINDLRHITMISIYTEYLKKNNIAYDIICTDRYKESTVSCKSEDIIAFPIPEMGSKKTKIYHYLRFRDYAIKKLKIGKYSYIISWGEYTTVLFSDYLRKHRPYCVNIRDVVFPSKPMYWLFWHRLRKAVNDSDFSTWCAPRGVDLLPEHEYHIVLNQNKEIASGAKANLCFNADGFPIHIGVVGYIRHIDASKELMKALCNDSRYILQFFGRGANRLEEYAKELNMINIEIVDSFRSSETKDFLNRIDVMNVYYGDGNNEFAMSLGYPIRFGYSTLLYKPAIVSPNTLLSARTNELNIAYTIYDIKEFPNDFYKWYKSLDFERFKEGCNEFNKAFHDSIIGFNRLCDEKIKKQMEE